LQKHGIKYCICNIIERKKYNIKFLSILIFIGDADRTREEWTCVNKYCQEQNCVKNLWLCNVIFCRQESQFDF